jgi:hypothetical protein
LLLLLLNGVVYGYVNFIDIYQIIFGLSYGFGCDTDDDRFATLVQGRKFYFIDLNSSTSFK